jgi:hypothetical protein
MPREVVEEMAFTAGVLVVDVVRWVRAVDEYLAEHRGDNEGLSDYDAAIAADPPVGEVLDGIAHAADKSLHQLVDLNRTVAAFMLVRVTLDEAGGEVRRNDPIYIWPDLSRLPQRSGPREQAKAQGYARHLARQEIDPVLARAVEFLRRHRP